jgi:hypothetical protein
VIPADYVCGGCKVRGVKLWRESHTVLSAITLACADCCAKEGHPVDLSDSDQTMRRVPAVPTLDGSYWGYTSVPPEGCAWWKALPLRFDGEWPVRGGVERWMAYAAWTASKAWDHLRRVDFHREGGAMALVFVPTDAAKAVSP